MTDIELLNNLMKNLGISEQEALEVLQADRQIDRGEKLFESTPEQKKAQKKAKNSGTKTVDAYGKEKTREKKIDLQKLSLMGQIMRTMTENGAKDLEIINSEREVAFTVNGKRYKVVLSCPRT